MALRLCLFATSAEMARISFVVRLLEGSLDEICQGALAWGYDGIELFPDPEDVPDPSELERAARASGCLVPVIDSGLMLPRGLTLLDPDPQVRARAMDAFERMIALAGAVGGSVNMGGARGNRPPGMSEGEVDRLTEEVFRSLAEEAEQAGSRILLEPTGDYTSYITTVAESARWAERIDSPAFTVMLDTYQLAEAESSFEQGIRDAKGLADHIHLYDPSRWPPGVLPENNRLDWPRIVRALAAEGFAGTGSVVIVPQGDPEGPARAALAYLRGLGV
jgi:D-psicose/D-tagatose/L-ribulose 3-epimerase